MALVPVGIMAMRLPDGNFLPAVPIYREIELSQKEAEKSEYLPLDELAEIFADKFKKHKEATEKRGYINDSKQKNN